MARSTTSAAASRPVEPLVIGHRGACATRPENTLAAFDEALRLGADGIETDLQLTRDGVVVLYHDTTLRKIGGGRRRVTECTADELSSLDAGSWFHRSYRNERIPTLAALLERYGGRTRLMLELKVDGHSRQARRTLAELTLAAVRKAGVESTVWVLSFDREVLRTVEQLAPRLPRVLDVAGRPERPAALSRALQGIDVLCLPARHVSRGLGERVEAAGGDVWTYRCDTEANLQRALRSGVKALITDRPDWARRRVRAQSASTRGRARSPAPAGPR